VTPALTVRQLLKVLADMQVGAAPRLVLGPPLRDPGHPWAGFAVSNQHQQVLQVILLACAGRPGIGRFGRIHCADRSESSFESVESGHWLLLGEQFIECSQPLTAPTSCVAGHDVSPLIS